MHACCSFPNKFEHIAQGRTKSLWEKMYPALFNGFGAHLHVHMHAFIFNKINESSVQKNKKFINEETVFCIVHWFWCIFACMRPYMLEDLYEKFVQKQQIH